MIQLEAHDPAYTCEAGWEDFGGWFAVYQGDVAIVTGGIHDSITRLDDLLAALDRWARLTPAAVRELTAAVALAGADPEGRPAQMVRWALSHV